MRAHLLTQVVSDLDFAQLGKWVAASMEYMHSGPDIVRSDSQRRLLNYWASLRGHAPLPIWRDLDAEELGVPLDSLAWTDVVSAHRDMRFRIGFHGAKIVEAFGPIECVGKYLDEVLPTPYLGPAVATYWRVVNSKVPIYTISDMRDPAGRIVHHERLLLPFSLSGGETERVLASIEAVSPEGPFELRDLMKSPIRPPVIALCATIQY